MRLPFSAPSARRRHWPVQYHGCSSIYKTSSVLKAGGYLPDLKWYSDWFMNAVIAFRDGICHIPETLSLVCVKSESYSTGRELDREQHLETIGQMLERILSPEFADVAPLFRRSGTFASLGTDLIRAPRRRPDYRDFDILSLVNGFRRPPTRSFWRMRTRKLAKSRLS